MAAAGAGSRHVEDRYAELTKLEEQHTGLQNYKVQLEEYGRAITEHKNSIVERKEGLMLEIEVQLKRLARELNIKKLALREQYGAAIGLTTQLYAYEFYKTKAGRDVTQELWESETAEIEKQIKSSWEQKQEKAKELLRGSVGIASDVVLHHVSVVLPSLESYKKQWDDYHELCELMIVMLYHDLYESVNGKKCISIDAYWGQMKSEERHIADLEQRIRTQKEAKDEANPVEIKTLEEELERRKIAFREEEASGTRLWKLAEGFLSEKMRGKYGLFKEISKAFLSQLKEKYDLLNPSGTESGLPKPRERNLLEADDDWLEGSKTLLNMIYPIESRGMGVEDQEKIAQLKLHIQELQKYKLLWKKSIAILNLQIEAFSLRKETFAARLEGEFEISLAKLRESWVSLEKKGCAGVLPEPRETDDFSRLNPDVVVGQIITSIETNMAAHLKKMREAPAASVAAPFAKVAAVEARRPSTADTVGSGASDVRTARSRRARSRKARRAAVVVPLETSTAWLGVSGRAVGTPAAPALSKKK